MRSQSRKIFSRSIVAAALVSSPLGAQASNAAAIRSAANTYRSAHEPAILREFSDLLSIPNLASDNTNIRRNANRLVEMLAHRAITTSLLEVEGSPPAVLGELNTPGATRTRALYAHYAAHPADH